MAPPRLADELLQETVRFYIGAGRCAADAADVAGVKRQTFESRLKVAAQRGFLERRPGMPGYFVKSFSQKIKDGVVQSESVHMALEPEGGAFQMPEGHRAKSYSINIGGDGVVRQQWVKTQTDGIDPIFAIKAAIEEFRADLPTAHPVKAPAAVNELLLSQYTVTDLHFGMLAWAEETGGANYDLQIAEKLLTDWFSSAVAMAPDSKVGILAQLGDLMHHDAMESVTPEHRNVLDADSRLQKIIRVVIRVLRRVIAMLLAKHERVHVIMASGNHDPASSAWLRELLFALYESEPRITIDRSPGLYYAFEWGETALFYHHGHRRSIRDVAPVFARDFREIYGRAKKAFGHIGHTHEDGVDEKNRLMRLEVHRTLAPRDAYAAGGGWRSDTDAKVINYHQKFGEVSRITLSPQMVTLEGR